MGFNLGRKLGGMFRNFGQKASRSLSGPLGVKLSHAATRTLGNVATAAQIASMSSNPIVKAMGGAVRAGANVGRGVIEVGKDLDIAGTGRAGGRAGMEKARGRVPALMRDAGDVGAGIATAAMFV
tara:strand:- start:4777 stop:5151 length:375 start_codon:yes stop_codon:yes gene_type:complete